MRKLLVLAVLAFSSACAPGMPKSRPHPLLAKAPDVIEQPSLEGDLVKFPKRGHVTVVDFWSTVCEPCLKMMPAIEALYLEHKAKGLSVVGVAVDDNPGVVMERLKKLHITYENLLDDAGSSRGVYQVDELPQTFVFDKKGTLRLVTKGGAEGDVEAIRDAVELLLTE